jgi:type I restriction enzyme, S subunit
MNRVAFFKHFELLADQPDAVAKMREFVMQLAIRGQLVEQIASEQKDVAWQKFNKLLESEETADDLPSFNIPETWRWTRLDGIADYSAARKVEPSEISDNAWVLDLEEIEKDSGRLLRFTTFEEKQSTSNKAEFLAGDVLYGKLRPYLNKVLVAPKAGFCTTEIVPIRSRGVIVPAYLCLFLRSPHFVSYTNGKSYGMKMPRLGTEDAVRAWIAVPPPAEQRRIVAKVDELMALCDELAARQQARHDARNQLQHAAFHHLLDAREPKTFATGWQRVRDHFHQLHETPDSIPQLRQAILQLAVQGRLISQNSKDEPAEFLLTHVRSEKQRLAKKAGQKLPKIWPPVEPDELPQTLPANWTFVRLGDLAINIEAGFSPQCEGRRRNSGEWGVLKISAVSWDTFDPEENKALPAHIEARPEFEVRDGDFLMSRANTAELVAKSVVTNNPPTNLLLNDKTLRVHFTNYTEKRFINLVNNSLLAREYYATAASGTSDSMKNITREAISMLPIGLPPLAEQKRIVARVEELMRQCDALEAQLNQSQTLGTRLLESTLHHLLAA